MMLPGDQPLVAEMMKALYESLGAPADYMHDGKIAATFQQLVHDPGHLQLEVFEHNGMVIGYALLFTFWYNEYGGVVLNIDELYVTPSHRRSGISESYLNRLANDPRYVALSLEVLPENKGAYALYKKSGFEPKETHALHKVLREQ